MKKEMIAGGSLELRSVKLSDLTPYENNPRIIDDAVPLVAESIRQCGYVTPIVVDEDGVILAGHTRYEALRELGIAEVEVIVAKGITEEQGKKYRILDNKTGELATWDKEKLADEISEIDFGGFDFGQPIDTETFNSSGGGNSQNKRTVICPRCNSEVAVV